MNYNNLVGKIFEDMSGNSVSVDNIDGSIAHLSNNQRIAVERLLDNSFYTEYVDPNIFASKENNFYAYLGNQIKSIDINSTGTNDPGIQISSNIPVVESHEAAQRALRGEFTVSSDNYEEVERRKREIAENAANISNKVQRSNEKLKELIGDDEDVIDVPVNRNLEGVVFEGSKRVVQETEPRETSVTMYDENNTEVNSYLERPVSSTPTNVSVEDPIYKLFSQVKRSTNFSLNVKLNEKIPRKDFIKMWEDSYEVSIIDFLVDEFTRKLLNDPSMIRNQLREALHNHVYGKPVAPKSTTKSTTKKTATKSVTKKPTVKK